MFVWGGEGAKIDDGGRAWDGSMAWITGIVKAKKVSTVPSSLLLHA